LDLFEARVFGWRFDFSSFSGGVTANASMAFSNDSGCSEIGFDLGRGWADSLFASVVAAARRVVSARDDRAS
jgi:hypothetical protein